MQIVNKNISREEKFLVYILFSNRKSLDDEIDLKKIDFDLLVKIASGHLMLPSLYVNLKHKGLLDLIPPELKVYLKQIFILNKNKNKELLKEVKEVSKILIKNNVNHVFIKGSALIYDDIYVNFGERMTGDIDILISKKDFEKSIKLLKEMNYKSSKPLTSYAKHYGRLINDKKIFAVELHRFLLIKKSKKLLNESAILNKRILNKNEIFIVNYSDQILYNIYNYQVNDYGSLKLSYSYRNFYDTFLIHKKSNQNPKFKHDKFIINYLMIISSLDIPILKFQNILFENIDIHRFNLKYSSRIYFSLDNFICNVIIKSNLITNQINEFIINNSFRKYILRKLFYGKKEM